MGGYSPLYIQGFEQGLIQNRENFILPADAFPTLENAHVWRERIKRKQGCETLGRLRRKFANLSLGNSSASTWTINTIWTTLVPPIVPQVNAEIEPGSVIITLQAGPDIVMIDQGDGTLATSPVSANVGTINYITAVVTLTTSAPAGTPTIISFNYFPRLPMMGLRIREIDTLNNEMTVAWDTVYAYRFVGTGWQEFIPGTIWKGSNSNFFWTTNYWVTPPPPNGNNEKVFWATNFSGPAGDPIRYTNGPAGSWIDFAPIINSVSGDRLTQCLAMLPFRSRMMVFNTYEGANLAASINYPQRIRWAAIGNPISDVSVLFPLGTVSANAWNDNIRGKGGFLDIPTSENITSVGFVRDNLVIYCERSTWQLRYTGRSIAPFQIEKVNSELGAESPFSAVQFDTSLVGIGDKGIVECDSFKSRRIDVKIPDLVFSFNNQNEGPARVYGVRDFINRLAFWTYPYQPENTYPITYPNRRLLYNYENGSWAIFTDSFTCFGTFQPSSARTWLGSKFPWNSANFAWGNRPSLIPDIVAGNQQGYVVYIDSKVTNDPTLSIKNITSNGTTPSSTPTVIESPEHNLEENMIIILTGIIGSYSSLNFNPVTHAGVYRVGFDGIATPDQPNKFVLWKYNINTQKFSDPVLTASATYIGGGKITIRDNFSIVSKKFNFLEEGQNIQIGYIDVLTNTTEQGAISLNIYVNYSDDNPINTEPQNVDNFFNISVPTTQPAGLVSSKNMQRVFCPSRGTFLTIEWNFSPLQMNGVEQESDVQIDAEVVWMRKAGTQLNQGI